MLLGPVVDDSILDLTRKADAGPDILEYLPLLLFVVSALGHLLKLLTVATFLEEVEVDSLVGTLVVASLILDGTLELERETLDRLWQILEENRERVAILLRGCLGLFYDDRTVSGINSLVRCFCLDELIL